VLVQTRGVGVEKFIDEYAAAVARDGGAAPFRVEGSAVVFKDAA
jgi:hypothetical protein